MSQFNRPLFFSRLIQKIAVIDNCQSERADLAPMKSTCINYQTYKTGDFNSSNFNYKYLTNAQSENTFVGVNNNYNGDGYYYDINTYNDYNLFYAATINLQSLNWLDEASDFLSLNMNFFNINMNGLVSFQIFYERIGVNFYPSNKLRFINLATLVDPLNIVSIIFALLALLTSIYMLLRKRSEREELRPGLLKQYDQYLNDESSSYRKSQIRNPISLFFKRIFYSIVYYFTLSFNAPNIFFVISK